MQWHSQTKERATENTNFNLPRRASPRPYRAGDHTELEELFEFVRANQDTYPVGVMCRLLRVSKSGFYAWMKRPMSARAHADVRLTAVIRAIHEYSKGTYGAPRIHAELVLGQGMHVARKRVARLMHAAGLRGVQKRRFVRTTVSDPSERWALDLVERNFTVRRPNRLWVADLTYVATWAGFLYVAVVIDAFSRRVIGWAMESHLRTELVLAALEMAYAQRAPCQKVIFHSDHGTQYTAVAFGQRCDELGVRPSMGSVGDAYDNAMAESFFASLECEVLDRNHFRTREEARTAVFTWIEGWYNPHRRHSSLGYLSPKQFEQEFSTDLESPSSELLTHSRQTARRVRSMRKLKSKAGNPKRRRPSTNHIIH